MPRYSFLLSILFYFIAFSTLVTAIPVRAEEEPVLREQVIVHSDIVTLGDLFENAGAYGNIPVFQSPDFGKDGVISAARVQEASEKQGLVWKNPGNIDKLVVRRPSRVLTLEEIKNQLRPALSEKTGIKNIDDITITFATGMRDLHIDSRITAPLTVMSLWYNPQNNAFRAQIGTEENTGNIPRGVLTGRVDETSLVVVPSVPLEPGKEITSEELKTVRLPVDKLRPGYIKDEKQAIGKTSKYRLAPNQIFRDKDLEIPKIIKSNDLVEIQYQVPGLYLKTQGRALGSGARGDVIPVLNTRSNRKIQAVVEAPGIVSPADSPIRIIKQPGS